MGLEYWLIIGAMKGKTPVPRDGTPGYTSLPRVGSLPRLGALAAGAPLFAGILGLLASVGADIAAIAITIADATTGIEVVRM
jgi:hypothetical protein